MISNSSFATYHGAATSKPRQMSLDFIAPGSTVSSDTASPPFTPPMRSHLPVDNGRSLPSLAQVCHDLVSKESQTSVTAPLSPTSIELTSYTNPGPSSGMTRTARHHVHLYHPYTMASPSPPGSACSSYSRVSQSRSNSPVSASGRSQREGSRNSTVYPTAPGPTPTSRRSTSPSADSSASSSCRRERPEYDLEEKFALAWLRLRSPLRTWSQVENAYIQLFPPGQQRRTTAPKLNNKSLPRLYAERSVGGYQCRYYRIRYVAGMPSVRDQRDGKAESEDAALAHIERQLAEHWAITLGEEVVRENKAEQHEGDVDHVQSGQVGHLYRAHSEFWRLMWEAVDAVRSE